MNRYESQVITLYAEEQHLLRMARCLRKQRIALERSVKGRCMNRIRETVGGFVALIGFLLMVGAAGAETIKTIIMFGGIGLCMMLAGGWMGHMFYGQEADAEWMRRLRDHRDLG